MMMNLKFIISMNGRRYRALCILIMISDTNAYINTHFFSISILYHNFFSFSFLSECCLYLCTTCSNISLSFFFVFKACSFRSFVFVTVVVHFGPSYLKYSCCLRHCSTAGCSKRACLNDELCRFTNL